MSTQLYMAEGIVRARVLEAKDAAVTREFHLQRLAQRAARRRARHGR